MRSRTTPTARCCWPWQQVTDIQNGEVDWHAVPFCTEIAPKRYLLEEGDIVIARTGATTGKSFLIRSLPCAAVFASYLIRVRHNLGVIPQYLDAFFQSSDYWSQIEQVSAGTAQPGANASILSKLAIPLAPLPEQQRIVARIDNLRAKSVRARENLDHIPRLVEKYKQAVLAALLTHSEATELSLDQLTASDAPIRYGVIQPGAIKDSGAPLIRVCDLENGGINWRGLRRISREIDEQYAHARVQEGDVLISVVGTIGRIALVDSPAEQTNMARAIARIRPDRRRVLPKWLALRLQASDCQRAFHFEAREVARKTLNIASLRDMKLTVPSISDQKLAIGKVTRAFNWIDRLASETNSARKLIDHLDQTILAKAFRGELVPQDPNDEPASVLLERIRAERTVQSAATGSTVRKKQNSNRKHV
jgi:type I restriction enzyme, S subunit